MTKQCLWMLPLLWAMSFAGLAKDHEVRAVGVKFDPAIIFIEPGDTISWTNMPAHLVETIDAMSPENFEKILSELGIDFSHTFNDEGIIVYKCTPHWGARMGGIIMVGKPDNIQETIDQYYDEIKTDRSLLPAKGLLKKFKKKLKAEGIE